MKEEIIKEIVAYPVSYGLFRDAVKNGSWDEEKLKYMDIKDLTDYLRDIKTFERNKERLRNGEYN